MNQFDRAEGASAHDILLRLLGTTISPAQRTSAKTLVKAVHAEPSSLLWPWPGRKGNFGGARRRLQSSVALKSASNPAADAVSISLAGARLGLRAAGRPKKQIRMFNTASTFGISDDKSNNRFPVRRCDDRMAIVRRFHVFIRRFPATSELSYKWLPVSSADETAV